MKDERPDQQGPDRNQRECDLPQDFRLYIIGKGREEDSLRQQVRQMELDERVVFMKDVPNEMLYRWYRSAQVLVMMSEAESFPMTSIEAVATGCRVVCSARSPFIELAQKMPEAIFPLEDVSPLALADKIIKTALLPDRADVDLSRYDWDNIARETLGIFEVVAASRSQRSIDAHSLVG